MAAPVERIRERIEEIRRRVRFGGMAGQQVIGGGVLIERARRRADEIARRLAERRPGIIPLVREFRPGERIRRLLPQVTDLPLEKGMAVAGVPAKPADRRDMAVHVE